MRGSSRGRAGARGIIAGVVADRVIGDPQRAHPVALFGRYALWLERHLYGDSIARGAVFWAAAVTPVVGLTRLAARRAPEVTMAVVLWASLGGTTLERVGLSLAEALEKDDSEAARSWIPWLCSRDPQLLDAPDMARAGTESLAENTSDAAVVPLVLAATGRPELVAAHRAINTLDAMVGYRSERYLRFGRVAAVVDDIVAYVPARINGALHVGLAATRGCARATLRMWREQAPQHPSPNAGVVESTAAGYLGVRLGGPTVYAHGTENRPHLGAGAPPTVSDLRAGVQLARRTQVLAAVGSVLVAQKRSSSRSARRWKALLRFSP
ncbi:cobalamin biosynthesis protein [Corynebacterium ciconiae DSM 44920]|uniref:CobD/CbiB family cobalamin biosynthesis protein n=1 Tax=Corynebacterium ciconiae TaxID=227319 RepID=UPI000475D8D8|nr:CobD/CbiB family cobalamin biosynthesis protein [Corynebacterium ciconiae]WKD60702.1 cobalamin biosynthesis protein [Corynebacterium ciconiae DSM 44920]